MDVILLSNDLVPGCELPVAAPGLRQWGIAQGLRAHGLQTHLVVPRHVADRMWHGLPSPTSPEVLVLDAAEIPEFVRSRGPAAVVLTNSNQVDVVGEVPDARLVFDFFAPKVLEDVCRLGSAPPSGDVAALRQRKIRALERADAVIVNGAKKLPYVIAWLLQTDRDIREIPVLTVPMCVPAREKPRTTATPPRVGIAGYLQAWSLPGDWLDLLADAADSGRIELHVLLTEHWGGGGPSTLPEAPALRRLLSTRGVVEHDCKTYDDFVEFLAGLDLVVDLFERTLEREYAMVTRTVIALAAGAPVAHPSFTEVSPYVAEAEAGWLVDVDQPDLAGTLDAIFADPAELTRRARNATELATRAFAPERAVEPLAALLHDWAS